MERIERSSSEQEIYEELIDLWLTELTDDLDPPHPSTSQGLIAPPLPEVVSVPARPSNSMMERSMTRWAIALGGLAAGLVALSLVLQRIS